MLLLGLVYVEIKRSVDFLNPFPETNTVSKETKIKRRETHLIIKMTIISFIIPTTVLCIIFVMDAFSCFLCFEISVYA